MCTIVFRAVALVPPRLLVLLKIYIKPPCSQRLIFEHTASQLAIANHADERDLNGHTTVPTCYDTCIVILLQMKSCRL
jgi:hypothetical protein